MAKDKLKKILKAKGLKLTKEREEIISEIEKIEGHFNPEELYIRMKNHCSKVSRASIYRTLHLLLECGFIEVVERFDRHTHYEKVDTKKHHDHMICIKCGKIIEFFSPTLELLQEEICEKKNFKMLRHTLEIFGYCNNCKNK